MYVYKFISISNNSSLSTSNSKNERQSNSIHKVATFEIQTHKPRPCRLSKISLDQKPQPQECRYVYIQTRSSTNSKPPSPSMSTPLTPLRITIIHKPLFQIPTQPTLGISQIIASLLFQCTSPHRIHIHPDQDLPFLVANTLRIMIGYMCPPSPSRGKEEVHHFIGYAVT